MIYAGGMIIESGTNDKNFRGILDGQVDLLSNEFIMSIISSLDK